MKISTRRFSTRSISVALFCAVPLATVTGALAGPDWVEGGNDAGSLFPTAQLTLGVGVLNSISGKLSATAAFAGDYEDVFLVNILDPASFQLTLAAADFNAQIYMFNITLPGQLFGLIANDDTAFGNLPVLTPVATDGSGAALTVPGQYAIGIAGFGRTPVSNSGAIFNFGSLTEISGADGPGGLNPLSAWTGIGETGSYTMHLEGTGFYDVPAPGAMALLAIAGLGSRRRRR